MFKCLHCHNVYLHQLFYLQIVIVTMNICLSRIEVRVLQYTGFRIHLLLQYI